MDKRRDKRRNTKSGNHPLAKPTALTRPTERTYFIIYSQIPLGAIDEDLKDVTKYLLDKNNIEGEVEDVRNIQHTYKNPEQKVRTGVWEVEIKTKKPINKTENKIPTMTMYFERPTFLKILNKPYEQFCQEIRDRQTQQEGDINFAPSQYRNIVLDRVKHDVSDDLIIVAIQTHL